MTKTAMAGGRHGNKSSVATSGPIQHAIQPASASLLYGGDNTSLQFLGQTLDGKFWLQWSQAMKLVIKGRGKLGQFTGATKSFKK